MKYTNPTSEQRAQILATSNAVDGLINRDRLKELCPLSDPTIWRLTQTGEFPEPVKLGRKTTWRLSSILWFCHLCEQQGGKS